MSLKNRSFLKLLASPPAAPAPPLAPAAGLKAKKKNKPQTTKPKKKPTTHMINSTARTLP